MARVPDADLTFALVGVEDTVTQLGRLLSNAQAGQFLSGVKLETTSGVLGRMYHDGSGRGRAEAENLLKTGTSSGARLLAKVDSGRLARVYEGPEPGASRLMVGQAGRLVRLDGSEPGIAEQPAGEWVSLAGVAMPGLLLGFNGSVFAENVVWDGAALRLGTV